MAEETKRKIGMGNKGKVRSEETRKKLSDIRKGQPSNNKGLLWTEEQKELKRKLSNKQVEELRKIYTEGGVFQKDLAKQFGVSINVVSRILNYVLPYVRKESTNASCDI